MRAMVLAAGFGSRLRPLTDRVPKPLLAIGGHPMIAYPLAVLRAAGVREVLVNVHHHRDQIRAALGDGAAYGLSIAYSEEDPILDTGGAIKKAEPFLNRETFVVMNADILADLDVADVVAWHRRQRALATMVLRPDPLAARYGLIEIDSGGRVRRILGRPACGRADLTPLMFAGVHVFEPDVFSYMEPGVFGIVRLTYPRLLAAGCPVSGYTFGGYWRVVDTHAGLAEGRYDVAVRNPIAAVHHP